MSLTSVIFPSLGSSHNPEAADAIVCSFPSWDFSHNPESAVTAEADDAAVSSAATGASEISLSSFPRHCLHISAHKNTFDSVF